MSVMIEVYYHKPVDPQRESIIIEHVTVNGGEITYREDGGLNSVCLTAEFDSWETANSAGIALRLKGEHVEGPSDYGDG